MIKQIIVFSFMFVLLSTHYLAAQRGYFDAPYQRYEAETAILSNDAVATSKSYAQEDLQSEASDQVCVDMSSTDATAEFALSEPGDGLVIRYSVPDGDSAVIGVYDNDTKLTSLKLTSKWSWESLWNNGDPNNVGISNKNPKMRFDEVRYKLPDKTSAIKLVKESGNLWIDFIETEPVADAITAPGDAAVYSGDGSTLQSFIDLNGGKTIFVPAGVYNVNRQLYFGVPKTKLQGAGMWYTQINFTVTTSSDGGLCSNTTDVSYSDLFLTTDMAQRTKAYSSICGVYTSGSKIQNIWAEHFGTGAWIAQYNGGGPAYADGFLMTSCRFRNTYADGVNLCQGTRNSIVEHCNFRNNGDDAQAIWCAAGLECINNAFRYNTVENGWRAAGAALYGGRDNKFYNILIKDNLEIGITITNLFQGVGFNALGTHDFHDISLIGGGTFNSTYSARVGSINIVSGSGAGTKVQNVRLYNIDIIDSKCDAIRIAKASGDGIFNVKFENVNVDGTGMEYPNNNVDNFTATRGFAVFFDNNPAGNASYCGLNYQNLGGNSGGEAFNTDAIGTFSWTELTGCETIPVTGIDVSPADTSIAGGATLQLIVTVSPADATNKTYDFSSSNPDVAWVNSAGLVTCLMTGNTNITVTSQDGGFSATSSITVTSLPKIVYKIKNRWQNTYLNDAGDRVRYTTTPNNKTYYWNLIEIDGSLEIKNYSTGDYMHIENLKGYVECTNTFIDSASAKWRMKDAGSGFMHLQNQMDTSYYIHIENLRNQAQYGTIESTWWSAMWVLEPVALVTSVEDLRVEKTALVYPNPSTGNFQLSISNFTPYEKLSISIFNLEGQEIYSLPYRTDGSGSVNLELSPGNILPPGNYYLVAKGNSNFARAKLLICK